MLAPSRVSIVAAVCLVFSLTSAAFAQSIKYEKYTLDNGLTVILHEDHSLPVAAVNLWYRVGAKEEQAGRSGFAHLFEHLMFMGTQRVPDNQFDVLMENGGGSNNASTSLDRTNYYSSGPSALLPTLLWLDADRLEDLGRTMDQKKLDTQRDVVRNELRQQVENVPYGKSEELVYRLMYPKGHPYHEAVYGTHEDLEAATVTNVKDFFATYYVPNNASLVVAGDFDSAKIKPLIQSLFGTISRGGDVVHRTPAEWTLPNPPMDKVVRVTMLDKVELPRLIISYHSPAIFTPGDADMDLLAAILTQGKSSRLYKRLILDEHLASDVMAMQNSGTLGSLFQIIVDGAPDADLGRIEKIVDEELARLIADGPTKEELAQRQATVEMALLARTDSLLAKADKLNEYEYFFGEPDSFKADLDRYRNATPASIQKWAGKVLLPDARAIIRVLPEEPTRDNNPRDQRPADFTAAAFTLPTPDTFKLSNGINVMVWPKPGIPLVAATLLIRPASGGPLVSNDQAGLAALTADMLDEGAGSRDAVQFADALQSIGADFGAGADYESFTAGITVLKRNFDQAAALLADAVRSPKLTETDFERVHRLHLDDLEQTLANPGAVAAIAGNRVLLGDANAYALSVDGLTSTANGITLADVRTLHASVFAPTNTTILVAGDITAADAKATLERVFGDWKAAAAPAITTTPDYAIPEHTGLRVYIIDRPEAVQTVIRLVMPGIPMADPNRATYQTLNTLLGGSFTSRLNQNLREKNGFTYGARSSFRTLNHAGLFTAGASVKADATGAAIREFFIELERTRAGDIDADEAGKAAQSMRTDAIQSMEGVHGPIAAAAPLLSAGLPYEQISRDLATVAALKADNLNAAARKAIPLDRAVLILVGDKTLILEQIKDLKLPTPIELTPEGAPK